MRRLLISTAALVLAGCGSSSAAPLVGNVPAPAKLPSCGSLKVSHHTQRVVDKVTIDSVTFGADPDCVQGWAVSLGKSGDDTGTLHSSFDAKSGVLVTVSRGKASPNSISVTWNHDGSLPAILDDSKEPK